MEADHFSTQVAAYRRFRPNYPAPLFDWLAAQAPERRLAWDCGCGNGQASADLAWRFERVVATDLSVAQVAAAPPVANVCFVAASASLVPIAPASTDLVAVAQALHWFDLPAFYAEVRRVLRPGGLLACWTYGRCRLTDPSLDAVFQCFYDEVINPYWPAERHHVETAYCELPFPFSRIEAPSLALAAEWSIGALLGYVASWSASVRFEQATGQSAIDALRRRWPVLDVDTLIGVRWPLTVLAGRP